MLGSRIVTTYVDRGEEYNVVLQGVARDDSVRIKALWNPDTCTSAFDFEGYPDDQKNSFHIHSLSANLLLACSIYKQPRKVSGRSKKWMPSSHSKHYYQTT
jgi:hypothetical protein